MILYIGGSFSYIGSMPCEGLASYDLLAQQWSCLGNICDGQVISIAIVSNYLFLAGNFTSFSNSTDPCPGVSGIKLARFDLNLNSFDENFIFNNTTFPGTVYVLATTSKGELFVGGSFYKILSYNIDRFALYNLTHWYSIVPSSAGIPFSGAVISVGVTGNNLYFGGPFIGYGYSGVARISSIGTISNLLSGLTCGPFCSSTGPTVYTVAVLPPGPPQIIPNSTTPPYGGLIGSGGQWEEYNITAFPGSSVYFQNDTNFKYSILTNSRPRTFYWQTWSVIGAVIFLGSLFIATLLNLCVKSVSRVY